MHCLYFASGQLLLIIFGILLQFISAPSLTTAAYAAEQKVPSKPDTVGVEIINATAVRINWKKPTTNNGAEIKGYLVRYGLVDSTEPYTRIEIIGEDEVSTTVTSLLPHREYSVFVAAFNLYGDGEASQIKNFITPGMPPTEPRVSGITFLNKKPFYKPYKARITWRKPEETYEMPVKQYIMLYKSDIDTQYYKREINGSADEMSLEVDDLLLGREYEFKIAAVTDEGVGNNATERLSTPEGKPVQGPLNLRYEVNNRQMTILWDPPPSNSRNGKIERYETWLTPVESKEAAVIKNVTDRERSITYNFKAQQSYKFKVAAATSEGLGPFSSVLNIYPDPNALVESPSNVRVQATSNSSAVVQWDYNGQNISEFEVRFMQQPLAGERRTEKWSSRAVADPSVRHLHIHHLTPGRSYAFCVAAIRDGRQGPCSDPPVAIERLDPTYVVSGLRLEFKTSNSVKLAWSYNGSRSVQFYVRYSGNKSYVDNNGKYFENNILPIEKNVENAATGYLLTELRPDMKYVIKVGVKENGRAYFPSEITVKTKCRASPMVDPPRFIGSKDISTASLMLGLASEEYGPISHYWLIVVPGNFTADGFDNVEPSELRKTSDYQESFSRLAPLRPTSGRKTKRAHKHKRHFSHQTNLSGVYVAANFSADIVRRKKRNNESFLLGDGERYGGFLNQKLEGNTQYRVLMRAFTRESEEDNQPVPLRYSKERLQADSVPSPPFSTQSFYPVREGKSSNLWLAAPLVALLLVALIILMLLLWLRWQRCNRKGSSHNSNRHSSVTKVAIGNIIPSETSKLLPSEYGRQIVNPYDQANGSNGCVMEPTTDVYPSQQAVNFTATPNTVSMLPSSGGVLGGHTLNHPPIPIRELASHIESLKMNNNALFSQEYESIETGQPFKWENSTLPCNKLKNRYANVVAYDHSRVELSVLGDDPSTDYINANFIDGYEKTKAYIATQGPLSETFGDFWRMVWEQNSATIVMLTRLEESSRIKCDQYWPSRGSAVYGYVTVALIDTLELAHYTIRTFHLQYRGSSEKREVHHLQYTAWPDHGVPEKPTPFLMFLKRVKTINPRKAGPIITHCSAGIGRTGAFIAIDCMLERLRYENSVDIFGCVTALRSQRSYMVQTEEQYIFIYDAVLDAAQSGSTEVPVTKLHTHIQRLLQTDSREPMISGMELEFRHLATLKMVNSRCAVANLQVNRGKNRLLNMVPYDSTRVVLEAIPGVSGSDYINASWIDGYRQRNAYIATQGPMECTVNDFWRMIWEEESAIIVMLVQVREFGQEKCFEYWPVDSGANFEHLYVEPIAEYNMSQYILREFRMTDTKIGQSRTVRHFQYMDWPERGIPKFTDHFIDFIHQVHHTKTQFGNVGPITVHCSTGTGRTGVFIALSIIIDRLKLEKVVDVFTTVKLLRTERQNMVQDKDQYHFCYQAALDFYQTCDNPYQT